MLWTETVQCPYCGESFEATIDGSTDDQEYIEDCYVCCQPIVFHVRIHAAGGSADVVLRRAND